MLATAIAENGCGVSAHQNSVLRVLLECQAMRIQDLNQEVALMQADEEISPEAAKKIFKLIMQSLSCVPSDVIREVYNTRGYA